MSTGTRSLYSRVKRQNISLRGNTRDYFNQPTHPFRTISDASHAANNLKNMLITGGHCGNTNLCQVVRLRDALGVLLDRWRPRDFHANYDDSAP